MLPLFLEAAGGLWDQLAVLDTGSADATIRLLREAGAEVREAAWEEDFSRARNQALAFADGDWVLVLDADEIVSPAFCAEVRELIGREDVGAATVTMRNRFSTGHHRDSRLLRLFRRDETIRYRHAIHEDAAESVAASLRRTGRSLGHIASPIEHLGYQRDRAAERDKQERDRKLLEAALARDPSDIYSRFKLLELARFWADAELGRSAAEEALEAIRSGALKLEGSPVSGELLVVAARFLHSDDPVAALELIGQHSARCETSPALLFGRGDLRERSGDSAGAEADFLACLELEDPTLQMVTTRPLMGLARLHLARGDVAGALTRVDEALVHSPQDGEALLAAISFRLESPGAVADFLGHHPWSAAVASALESAVELSALSHLRAGRVVEAHSRLAEFVERRPALGVGMLVCDLLLSRSSELELDLDLEAASLSLRRWLSHLVGLGQPALVAAFVANAPALVPTFPWLSEILPPS